MTTNNPNPEFPVTGISGKRLLIILGVILSVLIGVGLTTASADLSALREFVTVRAPELAIKLVLTFGLTGLFSWVFFTQVLDTPLSQLPSRFRAPRNNSHMWLFIGIVGSSVAMVAGTHASAVGPYISLLLVKGSLALGVSIVLSFVWAFVFGVRSMDQFRDWVTVDDNDNYAMGVALVLIVGTVLGMSV